MSRWVVQELPARARHGDFRSDVEGVVNIKRHDPHGPSEGPLPVPLDDEKRAAFRVHPPPRNVVEEKE